ncbi:MAG: exosortase family protein XrtG [Clostridium sp.]
MTEVVMFILIMATWVFAVVLFRNLKFDFFKFIAGSLGLFIILVVFFRAPLEELLINGLSYILNIIGDSTSLFNVIKEYGIVMVEGKHGGMLNMLITYQCSGIIELMVFSCLAIFFPFISTFKKIGVLIIGNLYLFVCNIIRILFIVAMVKVVGVESYEITHMILARILFFFLTVLLYYKVFTKNQLRNQQVGEVK